MQSKPKSNSVVTHQVAADLTITFNVRGAGEFTFDPLACSQAVRERAMIHGFIQRIADGAALGRDPETGLPATPQAKMARMQRLADHYASGTVDWNVKVAAGERQTRTSESSLVIAAIGEMKGWLDEAVRDWIKVTADAKGTTEKEILKALAAQPKVILKVAEIKERRAQGRVDTGLFDELMATEILDDDADADADAEDAA